MSKQSDFLRRKMLEQNLTVEQLADKIGISRQYVHRVLNGQELKRKAGEKWAKALNVPLEKILNNEDESIIPMGIKDDLTGYPNYVKMVERLVMLQGEMKDSEFAEKIGMSQFNYNAIKNYKRRLSGNAIFKISNMCGISKDWIKWGRMPLDNLPPNASINNKGEGVPYYDIDDFATMKIKHIEDIENPSFYVDFKSLNDSQAYLRWYGGDAMAPEIKNGDILALKRFESEKYFPSGEPYLVILNDEYSNMKLLRTVFHHADADKAILHVENPDKKENDLIVFRNQIEGLYFIRCVMKEKVI